MREPGIAGTKLAEECGVWLHTLMTAWRSRWMASSESQRSLASGSLINLSPPVQGWFYVCRTPPVEAACVLIRHDDRETDGAVRVLGLDNTGQLVGDAPRDEWLIDCVRRAWSRMRQNWTPDRAPEPPLEARHVEMRRTHPEGQEVLWTIPGGLIAMDVGKLVDLSFRDDPPASVPAIPSRMAGSPIYLVKERREDAATDRWLESPNLYFIYTQVATAREVAAYEFLRKEDDRFRSDEMARHRSDLARTLLSMPRNYKEINEYADYVLDYFEDLGLLLKRRVAPPYVVWTTSCYYVLRYWELLKDYVAWVRREKQDPTYHDAFEHLYKEMVKLEKKNTKKKKIELSGSELREFLEEELYLEIRAARPEDLDRIIVIERLSFEVDAYEKADFEQLLLIRA